MSKAELEAKILELNQRRIELDKRLEECNEAKKELDGVSNAFYKEIKDNKARAEKEAISNMNKIIDQKLNDLPYVTKTLVLEMKELERSKKGFGAYLLFFIAYMGLFTAAVAMLDISLPLSVFWRYTAAVIIDLILSGVSLSIINSHKNRKIKKIKNDEGVSQHLREITEIRRKAAESFLEIKNLQNETISKYDEQKNSDANNIDREIARVQAERKKLAEEFLKVEREMFAIDNQRTIFVYGHNKYYEYEIYVNGMLFSEVPARQMLKIKVGDGLTNIMVKSNHYEPADNHTYYKEFSRNCGVIQIEAYETPAFLMLDGFDIEPMNMNEFFYRIENKKFKEN